MYVRIKKFKFKKSATVLKCGTPGQHPPVAYILNTALMTHGKCSGFSRVICICILIPQSWTG